MFLISIFVKIQAKNIVLLCLLKNEYFREKDDVGNTLNTSERKALDNYLNKMFSEESEINNWQQLCLLWNHQSPVHEIKNLKNLEKPDFTTINEPLKFKKK